MNKYRFLEWGIALLFLLVLGFGVFLDHRNAETRAQRLRLEAYEYAVACSGTVTPRVAFKDIDWVITPGDKIVYSAPDGTATFAGLTDTTQNVIYIPETRQFTPWILRHEVLHMLGYTGHPEKPFRTCRVMPEQN